MDRCPACTYRIVHCVTTDHPYLMGLVGAGVGPSLTPPMHMEEARHHGLAYVYRVVDTGQDHLDDDGLRGLLHSAVRLGFDGLNVTFPYKQQILPLLDELSPAARRLGAVNTVLVRDGRLVGDNTDVTGFSRAVDRHLSGASLSSVVQLGAGGAGAAVADALLGLGATCLFVVDRDPRRARELAAVLCDRYADRDVRSVDADDLGSALVEADGLVNCTPTGMAHHPGTPVDPGLLRAEQWVADIVYRPLDTELLRAARHRGCRVLHGGYMAVYQAARTFELVTGLTPDPERMLRHLQRLVADPAP
jgi:shikimate dehydrogenase